MSNNKKFQNIMKIFYSNQEDNINYEYNKKKTNSKDKKKNKDNPSNKKDKQNQESEMKSNNEYSDKISQNSKNGNIKDNHFNFNDEIKINPENEIFQLTENSPDNNLYSNKNSLNSNNNSSNNLEGENFTKISFKKNLVPNSPEFNKKNSDYSKQGDKASSNDKINPKTNNNYINNNSNNITEKLEAKIEGNNKNQKEEKLITLDNIINSGDNIESHDQDGIMSFVNMNNINKDNEDNISKNSDEIERQKEEDFLNKEDLKVRKFKQSQEKEEKDEENGKENVTDEEDNHQINLIINKNNKLSHNIFSRNKDDNNMIISETQTSMNRITDMKVKDKNIEFLQNNIKNGDIQLDNEKESENNIEINYDNKYINNDDKYNCRYNNFKNMNKNEEYDSPQKNNLHMVYKKTEIKYNNKFISPKNQTNINSKITNNNINNNIYNNMNNQNKINNKNLINQNIINTNNDSNLNNNTENKEQSISSFDIVSTNKSNIIKSKAKGIYAKKKCLFNSDLNKIKKKLYDSDKKKKKEEKKNLKLAKSIDKTQKSASKKKEKTSKSNPKKCNFSPLINKKSKAIWEKRNKQIEEEVGFDPNKKEQKNIFFILNQEGINQKIKNEEKIMNENENIKKKANKKKINARSYELDKQRTNKIIDQVINQFLDGGKKKYLSIIIMVQCLCSLKIINELIKTEQISELNLDIIKTAISNIKKNNQKQIGELEFIEQLWFIINPSLEERINYKIFLDIIKKLFEVNNLNKKENSDDIKKLLEENKNSKKNKKIYTSPFRDETLEAENLWSIEKLIKSFLRLKSDSKAYNNDFLRAKKKEELKNKLIKREEGDLSFHPNINIKYIFKSPELSYYNHKKDDLDKSDSNITHKKRHNFEKTYKRIMEKEENKNKVLEKMRQIKIQKEEKKCTLIPKINEYKPRRIYLQNRLNKSVDYSSSTIDNDKKVPRYEKLYALRKINNTKKITLEEEEQLGDKYNSKRSFQDSNSKKSKSKNKDTKPNLEKNNIQNYAIVGKGRNNNNNVNIITSRIYQKKTSKRNHLNLSKEKNKKEIDNIYVGLDIDTPRGGKKSIRIYQNQDDIHKIVDDFCKKYYIKNEDNKKHIYNQVMNLKNNFFGRNTFDNSYSSISKEDKLLSDNLDTKTNTNNK